MPGLSGAPYRGTIYPGRVTPNNLADNRATLLYEEIMTDLVLMGIVTKEQMEQYSHRRIQPWINPMQPELDPFPTLVPKQYDPAIDGGKQLIIDPISGLVTPEIETGVFKQLFPGHVGIGYSVDPAGDPPSTIGTIDGQVWFMLIWNDRWEIVEWKWSADYNEWDFDAAEVKPIQNFQYVMVYSDTSYTKASGYWILETGSDQTDIPTWQPLAPAVGPAPVLFTPIMYPILATPPINFVNDLSKFMLYTDSRSYTLEISPNVYYVHIMGMFPTTIPAGTPAIIGNFDFYSDYGQKIPMDAIAGPVTSYVGYESGIFYIDTTKIPVSTLQVVPNTGQGFLVTGPYVLSFIVAFNVQKIG
jgi:hypothetical protein